MSHTPFEDDRPETPLSVDIFDNNSEKNDDSIGLNRAFIQESYDEAMDSEENDIPMKTHCQYGAGTARKHKFVNAREIEFFNVFAQIDRNLTLERRNKARLGLPPTRLLLKNLEKLPADMTTTEAVQNIFDIFIRTIIGEADGELSSTRFCLGLFHPGFMEAQGFWLNNKDYETINGRVLMNEIERFAQSNRNFSCDVPFTLEMHVFKSLDKQRGGCSNGEKYVANGIYARVQGKGFCMPKAIAIAKLWWARRDPNTTDTNAADKNFKNLARMDIDCSEKQKAAALEILNHAHMDLEQDTHDLDDLQKIADSMPDYRFTVWHRVGDFQKAPIINFEANTESSKLISLYYRDGHYDFVEPSRTRLGVGFCLKCRQYADKNHNRTCKAKCWHCGHLDCSGKGSADIKCTICDNVFGSTECYNKHKQPTLKGSKSNCEKLRIYILSNYTNGATHVCGETSYCTICRAHVDPKKGHNCCHNPPGPKTIEKMKLKQQKYTCLIYDFESIIVDSLATFETTSPKHKPNLVCYKMFCETCKGGACSMCSSGEFSYKTTDSVVDAFAKFLLTDPRLNGAYILAHNGGRYDHNFLIPSMMAQYKIAPEFIAKGQTIISVDIPASKQTGRDAVKWNSLCIRDSCQYLTMPLSAMPKAFGLTELKKGYYPYYFNVPENYGKVFTELPDKKFYDHTFMKVDGRKDFEKWYAENLKKGFDFDKELLEYCRSDVEILTQAVVKFIEICVKCLDGWNPILSARTLAGFVGFLLKHVHIKSGDIGYIPENGYPGRNNSIVALKYLMWLEKTQNLALLHARNGGEFAIKCADKQTIYVDGYDASTKTVYEVHGCIYHGCPKCYDPDAFNPFHPESKNSGVFLATETRQRKIEEAGYKVVVIWEHEINHMLKHDSRMRNFFKNCRHTTQLMPRESMYGGRVQPFKTIVLATPNLEIHYYDYCSLYPYVNMMGAEYPRGQPQVLKRGLDYLVGVGKLNVRGLIYADVLPPQDLKLPVLPYRVDGKLLFPLCRTCAENHNNSICDHHKVSERRLTGVWCTDEMNLALAKGYQILSVHEVWHWEKWVRGGYFESYLKPLLKIKHEASGWPKEGMTEEEKKAHVKEIFENDGVEIDIENVRKNPALRSLAKLFLNAAWGKFAENPVKIECRIFMRQDHVGQATFINDPHFELKLLQDWGDDYTFTSRVIKKEAVTTRGFANVVVGSITTAAGRIRLYEAMDRLGDNLCYCDTDSVMFTKTPGVDQLGDLIGHGLGKLENEVAPGDRITKLVAIASKVYAYELEHPDGRTTVVRKAKDSTSSEVLTMSAMEQMMRANLDGKTVAPIITTRKTMKRKLFNAPTTVKISKSLRPVTDKVRMNPDGTSLPLGWLPEVTIVNDE